MSKHKPSFRDIMMHSFCKHAFVFGSIANSLLSSASSEGQKGLEEAAQMERDALHQAIVESAGIKEKPYIVVHNKHNLSGRLGGPFYLDSQLAENISDQDLIDELGFSKKDVKKLRKHRDVIAVGDEPGAIDFLAHEVGHAVSRDDLYPRMKRWIINNPVKAILGGLTLESVAAGASLVGGAAAFDPNLSEQQKNVARAAALAYPAMGAISSIPQLYNEAMASVHGYKAMKKYLDTRKDIEESVKEKALKGSKSRLLKAWGTYAGGAADDVTARLMLPIYGMLQS
jgi:hypothetical protein